MIYKVELEYPDTSKEELRVDGIAITERLQEELDDGVITVPISTKKDKYPRWTKTRVWMDNIMTGMLIWGDKVDIVVKNPELYSHIIQLIEPTKLLERYTVPNLTFTISLNGIGYTMAEVVDRIINVTPISKVAYLSGSRVCVMSANLRAKLDLIPAPQFFLEQSNMREALIQVLAYVDAVPRLTIDGVLEADFFNEVNNEVQILNTATYNSEITAEEYATTMEVYSSNLIGEKTPEATAVNVMSRLDFIGVRSLDQIISDSNYKIILPYSIFRANKLLIWTKLKSSLGTNNTEAVLDISDYLFPYEEYKTLDPVALSGDRQSHAIWYNPGSNVIDGLTTTWGVFGIDTAIENILEEAASNYIDPNNPTLIWELDSEWYEFLFQVIYEPEIDSRTHIEREDISDINRYSIVTANARNSVVDAQALMNNMFGKVQRMGLPPIQHGTINTSMNTVLSIGDYEGDDIITIRERIAFNDFVIARYETTPKFNRVSQFIGVDREFRALNVPQVERIVTRHILYKEYIGIKYSESPLDEGISLTNDGIETFMQVFDDLATSVSLNIAEWNRNGQYVAIPCISIGGQSTIKMQFTYNSPNRAGDKLVQDAGRRIMKSVKYTDNLGFVDKAEIKVYNAYYNTALPAIDIDAYLPFANDFPQINTLTTFTPLLNFGEMQLDIDGFERGSFISQLQILPEQGRIDNIVVGLNLTTMNPLVVNYDQTDNPKPQLYIWTSDEVYTKFENKIAKGTRSTSIILVRGAGSRTIIANGTFPVGTKSWAIADINGNLYLAINSPTNKVISFNFYRERPGVIYENN